MPTKPPSYGRSKTTRVNDGCRTTASSVGKHLHGRISTGLSQTNACITRRSHGGHAQFLAVNTAYRTTTWQHTAPGIQTAHCLAGFWTHPPSQHTELLHSWPQCTMLSDPATQKFATTSIMSVASRQGANTSTHATTAMAHMPGWIAHATCRGLLDRVAHRSSQYSCATPPWASLAHVNDYLTFSRM